MAVKILVIFLVLPLCIFTGDPVAAAAQIDARFVPRLVQVMSADEQLSKEAMIELSDTWQLSYVAPLLETVSLIRNRQRVIQIFELLRTHTGESFNSDIQSWYNWLWNQQ